MHRWILNNRGTSGLMMMFALIVVVGGYMIWNRGSAARTSLRRLSRATTELYALQSASPPLTAQSTLVLEAELEGVLTLWEDLVDLTTAETSCDPKELLPEPMQRADVYFSLASFIERMRDEAERCGVEIKAQEQFGFSDHSSLPDDEALAAAALREKFLAEVLLKALFEARPQTLIAVQRARRDSPTDLAQHRDAVVSSVDYFEWKSRSSVRSAGSIETRAIRLSFVGQTAVLRAFLNDLANDERPLLVREVEVSPVLKLSSGKRGGGVSIEASPLITRSQSRFIVTVELLEPMRAVESERS